MKNEYSAGIILFNEKSSEKYFLLLRYPAGHWDFIKGKIENGETPIQTAIRESEEETGIKDLKFIDGFRETIHYTFHFANNLIKKQVIFFFAKTDSKDVKISQEHLDFVWLNFEDSLAKLTYDNAKEIFKKTKNVLS